MLAFAICLAGAGAVLSLFARLPTLLAVMLGVVIAVLGAGIFSLVGLQAASSTAANLLVAILAPQFGYGAGVVARALAQRLSGVPHQLTEREERGVSDASRGQAP